MANSVPPVRSDTQLEAKLEEALAIAVTRMREEVSSGGMPPDFSAIMNEEVARRITARDRHHDRRMPPRAFELPPRAVDLAQVARAGRRYAEARRALAAAKLEIARFGLAAYFEGCPADKVAKSAGVSYSSLCRWSWDYFELDECGEGRAFRKVWKIPSPLRAEG